MKKIYLLLFTAIISAGAFAQFVPVIDNPGTSGAVVVGQLQYHVSESIYLDQEIGTNNYTTAASAIQQIFFISEQDGLNTSIPNYRIYFKNIPAATTTFTTGTYSLTGYTLVFNGTFTATPIGLTPIILTTPFQRVAGNNLEMLIVRTDNAVHTGAIFDASQGNIIDPLANTTRRYNSAVAPVAGSSSLVVSNFRPAIAFNHTFAIDAIVNDIVFPTTSCFAAPQTIGVEILNGGTTNIAAGAATVTLHIGGANTFTGTLTNTAVIAPNSSEVVNFTGINLNNTGFNFDTAYVHLVGDGSTYYDTLNTVSNTAEVLSSFPLVEDAETTFPVFPYAEQITGGQLWFIQDGDYSNTDQTIPLVARAPGTRSFLFDSYSGASSLGFESRLYSNCIDMPSAASNPTLTFWMSHDNIFPTDLDSMYVSVSTDKGQSWTRLQGYRRPDAAAPTPVWRQETVNLSAYANQTIQIGFEGVSKYGNAISLDDINISISGIDATIDSISSPNITCHNTPQTITVRVKNIGTAIIPAGTANVTLHVRGANTFTGTQPVAGAIAIGGTALVNFTGINLNTPGTNFDTAFVNQASDVNALNNDANTVDFVTTTLSMSSTSSDQVSEDVEGTLPLISFAQVITGDRQLWDIWSGNYQNLDMTSPLVPLSPGSNFFFFDSYSGLTSTDGFESRLISNCITLPQTNGAVTVNSIVLSFWMSHDNIFPLAPDSLYLAISADHGNTWNRITSYARLDATALTPTWRMQTVDLIGYAGQTIQLGFEGVSKYGNIIGLDNINILTDVLPVSLLSFDAQRNGKVNDLNWRTAQELNSSKFVIERSTDGGRTYSDIGQVAAAGNSNTERSYRFTDITPVKGINYYRLRVVDLDNTFKHSVVKNVRNLGSADISFAPNPVQQHMNVKVDVDNADKGTIIITDMSGRQVYNNSINVSAGHNDIIVETGRFSQGSYIIQVQLTNDRMVKKFTKL